nr:MAG TPA: nucleoporin [Caudoviricetes sp.]
MHGVVHRLSDGNLKFNGEPPWQLQLAQNVGAFVL